jgi:hypothetical protein
MVRFLPDEGGTLRADYVQEAMVLSPARAEAGRRIHERGFVHVLRRSGSRFQLAKAETA